MTIVITSVAFSGIHAYPPLLPLTFAIGVAFGWIRERSDSTVPTIVAHVVHNASMVGFAYARRGGVPVFHFGARSDGRGVITFRLLKPGTYAVTPFQDENNNEILDRDWLGFLAEPTAVSNNLKSHIGRPTFDAAKFTMQDSLCIAMRFQ